MAKVSDDVCTVRRDPLGRRIYKTFMIVSQAYRCDKDCPYCTAKITQWPEGEDQWAMMVDRLTEIRESGIIFEYVTISGNGEPSSYPHADLVFLRDVIKKNQDLFSYNRMQTSGLVFYQPDKHALFADDYVFEITRVSTDVQRDMQILRYKRDYTQNEEFRRSSIIFNHTLLRENIGQVLGDIKHYLESFPNLYALNLKILNTNTMDEQRLQNPGSQWILDNGILKGQADEVASLISGEFPQTEQYDEFYDRVVFEGCAPDGRKIPITFFARKTKYGLPNIVYYCGDLVDYSLNKLDLAEDKPSESQANCQ